MSGVPAARPRGVDAVPNRSVDCRLGGACLHIGLCKLDSLWGIVQFATHRTTDHSGLAGFASIGSRALACCWLVGPPGGSCSRAFVAAGGDRPVLLWSVYSVGALVTVRTGIGRLRPPPGGCGDTSQRVARSAVVLRMRCPPPLQPNTASQQLALGRGSVIKGDTHRA
jgi:hypothetical protein